MHNIKILLVDDHSLVREGLRHILDADPRFTVVGEASSGREAVALCREKKPDVVLMDVTMPDMNGMEATLRIHKEQEEIRVIALSMHCDQSIVQRMLMAGADGYLVKDSGGDEIRKAVKAVAEGRSYLCPQVAGMVIENFIRNPQKAESGNLDVLTSREREVLQLIAEGFTSKRIAAILNLSVRTVENHRRQIMFKLNLHSVAALTKYAITEGLTDLSY